ncbi:MAG: rRNA maturation RNase YbeY [Alphaproteobacteria bacterium]|nr:MAG: rRNA maturation RNase YbeY [Alphaproteobacteria bacterium]
MTTIEPAPLIDVIVESPQWDAACGAEATVRGALAEAAIATGKDFTNRTLAVLLTDDASVRRLNAQWRGIDKPTNVLSFAPAPHMNDHPGPVQSLGDIAIAGETTAREAAEEHKPFDHHLAHLAVHGFLHLLGYDHDTGSSAATMEQLERVILARLGVPDPYLTHEPAAPRSLQQSRS